MAKERDGDALGANQSKMPPLADHDNADQPPLQQPPQQQQARVRTQKHIVGGGVGVRVHARVPSSKALKHHAAATAAKLNRRQGSVSPDRGPAFALPSHHHRRATSELRLTADPTATNLKKNLSHTNLKRNRSQVEVGKRNKSTTSLHRSASNTAVDKLRPSGSSRVQFNLGDDGQGDDDPDDDEWVDASTSASPLLSRRGSAVSASQTAQAPAEDGEAHPPASPSARHREDTDDHPPANGAQKDSHGLLPRNASTNQYLTSRILSRTPSHGAPPMMSAETVSVRPPSLRQQSPPNSNPSQGPSLSGTPGTASQVRPGSSGKAELTSRFVGNNSQEAGSGSGVPGDAYMLAANRGGLSRAALNGKAGFSAPQRRQSLGALSQGRGMDALDAPQKAAEDVFADDDEAAQASRTRRRGDYVVPGDLNRTQQKLNLQRASSSLEQSHPHPGVGIGPAGVVAPGAGPLLGVPNNYDSRDPRIGKLLERTGMEYLTVRRHLNPIARSLSRVMQLPGLEDSRRIPPSSAESHPARASELAGGSAAGVRRSNSMADLINGQPIPAATTTTNTASPSSSSRPPPTPRRSGSGRVDAAAAAAAAAFSDPHSAASSLGAAGAGVGVEGLHGDRATTTTTTTTTTTMTTGLSGSSLVDGAEDAGTVALLRMMWDKNLLELSPSSQD